MHHKFAAFTICALLGGGIGLEADSGPEGITWETHYASALGVARTDMRVIFLAVNMDGERANDYLAEETYFDEEIVALSKRSLNLVASAFMHGRSGGKCSRFPGVQCKEHQEIEKDARKSVIRETSEGKVIAPQHIFLDHKGDIILSVAYLVSREELLWCFHTALSKGDPNYKGNLPENARPPHRLIMGKVYEPEPGEKVSRPLNAEELKELMREVRAGFGIGSERDKAFLQIISTDHRDAIEFAETTIKGQWTNELKARDLAVIGEYSPQSFWTVANAFIKDRDPQVRNAAAIALEQIAAPKSARVIVGAMKKEKDPKLKKNWIRALGTAGAQDKNARKVLLKIAEGDKDPLLQINAMIALAGHLGDEKVKTFMESALANESWSIRLAAACSIAFGRAVEFLPQLQKSSKTESHPKAKEVMELAQKVLEGGNLDKLAPHLVKIAEDQLPRPRFFQRSSMQ